MKKLSDATLLESVEAVRVHGNQQKAAKALGIVQSRVSERIAEAKARGLHREQVGRVEVFETRAADLPTSGKKTYLLTCAQNHTKIHPTAWRDLLALAKHDDATILVSTFKYNKDAQGQRAAAKYESREQELACEYAPEIIPYVCDDRVDLAPNITFCGELNVLPTASNPLEGLESYTYRKSTIVPHPKLALQSCPSMPGEGVKLMYTTGCITQRNYIKRKVGYKAESFHSYGALLIEIDSAGHWYCRQLQVGPDGAIYDLDRRVKDGKVTTGHRVECVTLGDVHAARVDKKVADVSWGKRADSMLEVLRPKEVHVHDLLDFSGRSHHTRKDPHAVFKAHMNGEWVLTDELRTTADMLWNDIARPWCKTVIVNSNHDRHLEQWLKEVDWRLDPPNAIMLLKLNLSVLESIKNGTDKQRVLLGDALKYHGLTGGLKEYKERGKLNVRFLREDESYVILPNIDGGIECGIHGDRGANGAKGTIVGIARTDRKANGADKHVVAIMNHAFFCGTSGRLVQGWNHGLSSWSHGHIITYPNGTRAILSVWKGKWHG